MKNNVLPALLACLFLTWNSCWAQSSPNGKIHVSFDASYHGLIVSYREGNLTQPIMAIALHGEHTNPVEYRTTKVSYEMPVGKKHFCTNAYNQSAYWLVGGKQIFVRAYNDGIAWYGPASVDVSFEPAIHNWIQQWSDSYESFFPLDRQQNENERYGYPALFEYPNGIFALLSESDLREDNAATSFYGTSHKNRFHLMPDGDFAPGWQTLIIGHLNDVVESTLITDNSAECKIESTNWIEPGTAAWVYWANNHGSNNLNIIKAYTDLAVSLHLPYVLIDAEWDEMDKVESNQGMNVETAVEYAVSKGIKPLIWYSSSIGWINGAPGPKFRLNTPEDREKEFAWCEKIGVKGVKIDFFSGDTNENIKFMIELLECAAKHHLLVNFHGATIPRGWQRTYPNLISTEAVYGAEWYNNTSKFTEKAARHNATLPFTRNVIGSMDYTPCAFSDSQHPHITTHAHELALTALYESGIQHLADRPESFLAQPYEVRSYLAFLPTAWDETLLLSGYPGESVVMARRKGRLWYIAGINGRDEAQTLTFDTARLRRLGSDVTLFEDSPEADGSVKPVDVKNPWQISKPVKVPTSITCQPRGGFVMVVR